MSLYLNYPLSKAMRFLTAARDEGRYPFVERAHILVLGPIAFAIIWRVKLSESPDDPR